MFSLMSLLLSALGTGTDVDIAKLSKNLKRVFMRARSWCTKAEDTVCRKLGIRKTYKYGILIPYFGYEKIK